MVYLIVGLGNIGAEYAHTRHNIGFDVVDRIAEDAGATWEDRRYGFITTVRVKNQTLLLLKPSTYMNLSGNAVRYWMRERNIPLEQVLVVVDDLALPFGRLRLKASGSEAGHNATSPKPSAHSSMPACVSASATNFRAADRSISSSALLKATTLLKNPKPWHALPKR